MKAYLGFLTSSGLLFCSHVQVTVHKDKGYNEENPNTVLDLFSRHQV